MTPLCLALAASTLAAPPAAETLAVIEAARCKADVDKLASFGTRHALNDTKSETRGSAAAQNWIKSEFEAISKANGGKLAVHFEEFDAPPSTRLPKGAHLVNVVAVLPGSDPQAAKRAYYVLGHYDSRNGGMMDAEHDAPGANDDASGVTVAIECARALAAHPPKATVVFVATAAEEAGLIGAKHHAETIAAQKPYEVMGVLNNDIVGDPSPAFEPGGAKLPAGRDLVRVFSEGVPNNPSATLLAKIRTEGAESDSTSRELSRFVLEVARWESLAITPVQVFRQDRFLRGGDHSAFNDAGFPAVRFSVPAEDYTRQHVDVTTKDGKAYGDVPSFVDGDYLANVARINAATLWHLANGPATPRNVRTLTKELTTDATLRWDAQSDASGYEVVWRLTTEAEWTHAKDLGTATEARLPMSKDNFFFGVRAYDKQGLKSPVAFAWASRE